MAQATEAKWRSSGCICHVSCEEDVERIRSDEAERYQQIIGALTAANASLSERLRELEPPGSSTTEATDDAETVEEAPDRTEPRSAAGGAQEGVRRRWWRRVFRG